MRPPRPNARRVRSGAILAASRRLRHRLWRCRPRHHPCWSDEAMAQTGARKTFVLIHGAWHGGWCWRRVADLLEAKGHKIYAPSLTGNADRSHLLSKDLILHT